MPGSSRGAGAQGERAHPPSPLLLADDPERFATALAAHPLLADARILAGDALADVAGADLTALLARHPVLRRREAPWDRNPHDGGVERALSLIESHDATHLVRLSLDPPRVMLFALPAIANDPHAESEIALAQRVGEFVFAGGMGAATDPRGSALASSPPLAGERRRGKPRALSKRLPPPPSPLPPQAGEGARAKSKRLTPAARSASA